MLVGQDNTVAIPLIRYDLCHGKAGGDMRIVPIIYTLYQSVGHMRDALFCKIAQR